MPSALETELALHLRAYGIKLEREHKFHPKRKWRFDFADIESKTAFEVEGGTWMAKSGHNTGLGIRRDIEKYNAAQLLGWRVFRVDGGMIKSGEAIRLIIQALM